MQIDFFYISEFFFLIFSRFDAAIQVWRDREIVNDRRMLGYKETEVDVQNGYISHEFIILLGIEKRTVVGKRVML